MRRTTSAAPRAVAGSRRILSARTRVLVAIAAPLIGFLVAEAVARWLGLEVAPEPTWFGRPLDPTPAEGPLEFVNAAGDYRQAYRLHAEDPARIVKIHVNGAGFRGKEVAQGKASGSFRIACLGDSYTFGFGVSDHETWPAQLDGLLHGEDARVEVINAGVNNYHTRHEVELLRRRVLKFGPDLVLLAFFLNDAAIPPPGERGPGLGYEYGDMPWLWRLLRDNRAVSALRRCSRLLDVASDRVVQAEYLRFLGESRSRLYTDGSSGWRIVQEELKAAKTLLDGRGIRCVVILYPMLVRTGDGLATRDAYGIVRAFLEREGIRCLDLETAFLAHDVEQLRVHPRDAHPNAAGHRIAAEAIAAHLREKGLLR